MATRFYLTKNAPPAGAPRTSQVGGVSDSGGLFAGAYTYPSQGGEGWATKIGATIPSYSLTLETARAGARKNILVSSGTNVIQKIAGQSIGTFYWHFQQAAGAVFSIRLNGVSSLSGSAAIAGLMTRNVSIQSWTGKVSFSDGTKGPGLVGCMPRLFYIWRPSTQAVVGIVAEAYEALRNWTDQFSFSLTSSSFYMAVALAASSNAGDYTWGDGAHYYTVSGIQAGDLLCAEYWSGRTLVNGSWGFDPWDKETYPDSIDGDLNMATGWNIPVGGTDDTPSGSARALGTYRSFFESTDDIGVTETPPGRPVQVSVGF